MKYPVLLNKGKIEDKDNIEDIWNLLSETYKLPDEFDYQMIQVDKEYTARPDLLSKHIYGTINNADIICKLNGVSNPFELCEGMYIIVPEVSAIPFFYNIEGLGRSDERLVGEESVKKMQKRKNEPRAANEQVIGDTNFRIDKRNKIIIY